MPIYSLFVDYRFVDSQFVYTLNNKTPHSQLTKLKNLKLNAKTGGGALSPRTPLNCLWLAISNWSAKIIDELWVDESIVDELKTSLYAQRAELTLHIIMRYISSCIDTGSYTEPPYALCGHTQPCQMTWSLTACRICGSGSRVLPPPALHSQTLFICDSYISQWTCPVVHQLPRFYDNNYVWSLLI